MKPLTTIDMDSCTLIELAVLFGLIAAERWADKVAHDERPASFAGREKARRAGGLGVARFLVNGH
ncbi:MAG: hypothetical protein QM647_08910 [Asticcacaulis sp.]|uniref:hypothetical protein n=1 Tax=Asticcacaulis sp. TaxID=1872648 RepID=UPI0039E24142